jgi:hypothetical protein
VESRLGKQVLEVVVMFPICLPSQLLTGSLPGVLAHRKTFPVKCPFPASLPGEALGKMVIPCVSPLLAEWSGIGILAYHAYYRRGAFEQALEKNKEKR